MGPECEKKKRFAAVFGFWDDFRVTASACFSYHIYRYVCVCVCVSVSVCVSAIKGLRFASLTFMYAFDVKQSKYLRH